MLYMNDYDLMRATARFRRGDTPNRLALARMVDNLRVWANQHSDGWAYWPKPCRAAKGAMLLIRSTTNAANDAQERTDATDAETRAAVRTVKAFLTRQGVSDAERAHILGDLG